MRRRAWQFGLYASTLALGALLGFALGQRQGISWANQLMIGELNFGLSVHSEVASLIRVGDTERALWWLDRWIDSAVLTVGDHSDGNSLRGLQLAKVYRGVVAPAGADAARVTAALSRVPNLEPPFFCPTPSGGEVRASGLDRLAESAQRQ
jgi:hypothetical protein